MITEDYVSFEVAKLLKENGFDEPCGLSEFDYDAYKKWVETAPRPITLDSESEKPFRYPVPSIYVAMKWLRKVHNLFVFPFPQMNTNKFWVEIFQLSDSQEWVNLYCESIELQDYKTQEEACEAGVKYCLENLI